MVHTTTGFEAHDTVGTQATSAQAQPMQQSNPALQNLRLIQSISAAGNTLVMGLPTGFVPLHDNKAKGNGPDAKENEVGEP